MSSVEVIRSHAGFAALADECQALSAAARSPLFDHDWFLSAAEAFAPDGDLRVVAVRRAGALEALAPLAVEATRSGARLTLLGTSRLDEPGALLFRSVDTLPDLIDPVLRLGAPLLLSRIAAESPLCRILPERSRGRALTVVRSTAPSFAVATGGRGWADYYSTLSSRITANLPRVRKKAERTLGVMKVTERKPTEAGEVDEQLKALAAIEGSGWKGRRGSSLSQRTDLRRFFRAYCHRAAARRRLRIRTLSFGAHLAAMELSVQAYDHLWQLKIGYQESLSSYYPGLLLTESSIRAAFDEGLEAYEFLGGAEAWEERWRPIRRDYRLLLAYPLNAGGMVGACRDLAGVLWRRAHAAMAVGSTETRA